jgi:hypothetical protein
MRREALLHKHLRASSGYSSVKDRIPQPVIAGGGLHCPCRGEPSGTAAATLPIPGSAASAAIAVAAEAGMDPERLQLELEGAIRQAAPLAQEGDRLIYHRDKVHSISSLPSAGPLCS